ncbi:MAG: cobalt ECF transporter T component CbiQ [Methanospirillum sp.]|nr:cobalt ECF transporter T component CbiQ [Methanospirillum sp.]
MIERLFEIERLADGDSPVHRLDARVKIMVCFGAVVALVALPRGDALFPVALAFGILLALFLAISRIRLLAFAARVLAILPFGLSILVFQVLFPASPVHDPTVVVHLLPGLAVTAEALEVAVQLGVRFLLCLGFVILLSSTTRVQDLLTGARRLGLPSEFTLILGMMTRYLFVFGQMFVRISNALATRCFDPLDRALPYGYRLRETGYTLGTMFIRSYEQGERTYQAMLCRGYGKDAYLLVPRKPLLAAEWVVLGGCMAVVVGAPISALLLA